MEQSKYEINERGEISREDYFFSSVKGNLPQALPTNRKVWKVWLLSFITLGIYGVLVLFAMAKETNISCAEDGKHTRSFWGALLLTIITFGIYGLVWYYKWADREYCYLQRNSPNGGALSGVGMLALMLITMIMSVVMQLMSLYGYVYIYLILYVVQLLWGIFVMSKYLGQHNTVNKIYNLRTFGERK